MQRDLESERHLPRPPEAVWRAVSQGEVLGRWFMPTDLEPTLGKQFTFRMKPQRGWDGVTHCEVIELEPGRRIAFSYRGEATGEKTIACAGVASDTLKSAGKGLFTRLDTVLRFLVHPEGEGTRLTLQHQGYRGFQQVVVSLVMELGWRRSVLPRLDRLLAEEAATTGRSQNLSSP